MNRSSREHNLTQPAPNYLRAMNVLRDIFNQGILGGDINDLARSLERTRTLTLNLNDYEILADVVDMFTRRITDIGSSTNSSETTIDEIRTRRDNLRNRINNVIDNFMELSSSIDNLPKNLSRVNSNLAGNEYKSGSRVSVFNGNRRGEGNQER